jgi:serine/threonine protein kinase/predicted ATPase
MSKPKIDLEGQSAPRTVPPSVTRGTPEDSSQADADPMAATGDHNPAAGTSLTESIENGTTPVAFDRYQVRGFLGKGGFGSVYLGYDAQLDRQVAIKVPNLERQDVQKTADLFLQEARRIARLRHPGIVTIFDVGVQNEQIYLITDYIDGVSLSAWLRTQQPAWRESTRIVAAAADALACAHEQRVVHRDIKPSNILLTRELAPVLIDFGLGLSDDETAARQRHKIIGTPIYMSPEQARGEGHRIDGRTDIYSLGVVLYQLLCRRPPFRASQAEELFRQIREDEPQPPRQLVRELPRELEKICLRALAKRIADRYTTAGDFAEDLRRVLGEAARVAAPAILEQHTEEYPARPPQSHGTEHVTGPPLSGDTLCNQCGHGNHSGALFCSYCGAALSKTAGPVAGAESRSSSKQTSPPVGSGSAEASRKKRDAERRQVSMLYVGCELFDSTEYLENLDAEDQHEILRAYQQACAKVVQRFDGSTVQLTEHNLLVCFGFPKAHEDSTARAVRAGLGIIEEAARLNERLLAKKKLACAPSVGIHTGMVVVGDQTDGGAQDALSVVGEARNVVTRMDHVTQANAVVISQATHHLVQGYFACESLGRHTVKGVTRPLEFFRVTGETDAQSRLDISSAGELTPLVGRDREVGLLQDRWEQAVEGMGQVVLVIGEPGLGKSRLIHVIKQHVGKDAAGPVAPVVEWRCSPYFQNSGLFPIVDFFQRQLGLRSGDAAEKNLKKLAAYLEQFGLSDNEHGALFAALLSIPSDGRYPPLTLSPARQKEKTFEALLEWLAVYAQRQPVLFVVEDLHWVDPSTLELLALHVQRGLHDRILTLLTFRPEFETPWKSLAHQTVMALNRLTKRQVTELMQRSTKIKDLPAAIVEKIVARTDGVPLFVEEFTRMVMETGFLRERQGALQLSGSFPVHEIPATLQDLLMARLDRMDSDREVIQLAATLGREFGYALLQAVSPLDEASLQSELAKLVEAEILYQKGQTYQFKHALIQDAAYLSMLKAKRHQFHQRAAEILETRFPEIVELQPEVLAHHFTEASLPRQAIDYWLKAGLRSQERSANREAISHFQRGLELIQALEEGAQRDRLELELQVPLGAALVSTRGYAAPEVGPVYDRAHALSQKIGDARRRFHVLYGLWGWHLVRDELEYSKQLSDETLELAKGFGDQGLLMEAYHLPANTLYYLGDFAGARAACEQGFALYDRDRCMQYARVVGQNSGVTLQSYWALALWNLGYPDQALARSRSAVALAEELNHPFSHCYALHFAAWLHQFARLGKEAQAFAEKANKLATDQGFAFWKATGLLFGGAALLLQDRVQEAVERIDEGLASFRATGAQLSLSYYNSFLAEAQRRSGKLSEALKTLDEALAIVARTHNRYYEAELLRQKGELLLEKLSDDGGAAACFQQSIAVARGQHAKSWELRSALSLAQLLDSQGRRAEAAISLRPVFAWFTEGSATPDWVEAKKHLEMLA